jgi:shikimate kinase
MNIRLKRTPGIYLLGFMGCGKTTVGRMLAEQLGWNFVDLDEEIEAAEQMSISEIFRMRGEPLFRMIEREALLARVRLIQRGSPHVVALGGGAYADASSQELLRENGVSVWLDCPLDIVERRVANATHRPLARDTETFRKLFNERLESYARADYRIPIVSDDPAAAVAEIRGLPLF